MGDVVAVDLGATRTRVAHIDDRGTVVGKRELPTPSEGSDPSLLLGFLYDLIHGQAGQAEAIGLSVAGPVDRHQGMLKNPPNMPFRDVPLTGPLSREFGIPVYLINDCHAGILGEMEFGRGKGKRDVVYITISTGIGGGVLSAGRILLGRDGNAAEIGHFHVDDVYALPCGCGNSGHWEGYASGRFIPAFFSAWCQHGGRGQRSPATAAEIFAKAGQGDPDALCFLDELAQINGRGVSDVIVAYDPEMVVFDGAVMLANSELLLPRLTKAVDRYLPLPELVLSGCEGLAPLLGAGIIARGYETRYGSFL
jgi:glucokinase